MTIQPADQALADLVYHAKKLTAAYAERQRQRGKRQRIDNMDSLEILHAIARYMTIHNIER